MKNILFDMDGTLYGFENGQYRGSKLENQIQSNVLKLLKILEGGNAEEKFDEIKAKYKEDFSMAFEKNYNISKIDYFDKVWDVEPNLYIKNTPSAEKLFRYLKSKNYDIYIVSESPIIWIKKVMFFLKINNLINGLYSGQGEARKSNGLLYEKIISDIGNDAIMVGDQISSDIIMPKKYGFKTVFISRKGEVSSEADFNIKKLDDLLDILS